MNDEPRDCELFDYDPAPDAHLEADFEDRVSGSDSEGP